MRRLVVTNSVTLDGVMQAPGRVDEDTRDGFPFGGWAQPYNDSVMAETMGRRASGESALLFGRRTYEDFASVWPNQGSENPFAAILNGRQKYVVSTTLAEPLSWQNSTLLPGDPVQSVAALKQTTGPDLAILGSGVLVQSLLPHGLIDELVLLIHPLVLGRGRRLFADGAHVPFRLVDSIPTTTGVIIATYRPVQ